MAKPILLGVDGEAKELFINEGNVGLYFKPEDEVDLAKQIKVLLEDEDLRYTLGSNGKSFVKDKFDRSTLAYELYQKIRIL